MSRHVRRFEHKNGIRGDAQVVTPNSEKLGWCTSSPLEKKICYTFLMEALSEKYLEKVAQEKGIDKPAASRYIDTCIKQTAARLNIPYKEVYSTVYNKEYLLQCLRGTCSDLDLERCQKSCHCVVFEDKCISRKFPDAELVNQDPDKYLETHKVSTKDLEAMVKLASFLYYNYDAGGLTDNSFDALEYHLKKRLRLRGRLYEKIGAPPVEKIRTRIPYPLPSLKKVRPGTRTLFNFLEEHKTIAWSLKLDGVSGMVVYKDRGIAGIYTRGDGTIGGDITFVKDYISFPTPTKDYVVRGEFILSKKKWEEKYSSEYSNARSFVSGKINSGFVAPSLPDIDFVAYQIMRVEGEDRTPVPSQGFKILEAEGFNTVENGLFQDPVVFDLMARYKEKRQSAPYFIDGLVITADISTMAVKPGTPPESPELSVAFKMQLEELIRHSKIINVDWNISRYGRYVPVAIFESVYVEGVRLHRATAYNAAHIRDWSLGKGTEITVVRSGDVIPIIRDVEVDHAIEPIMPPDEPKWHWQRLDIVLDDIEGNREVQIKRIVHFFSTIGVPRLKEKTAEKMWEAGMCSAEAVASATPDEYQEIRGIGKKTADFFYQTIHQKLRTTPIDRYLVASTTLKVGLGRKLIKTLFKVFPKIFEYSEEEIRTAFKKRKIRGFGPKRINNIAENMPKFRNYLYSFAQEEIEEAIRYNEKRLADLKAEGYNSKIEGKTFVLTGFRGRTEYDFEDYIYDNQGDFSSTVTSQTEAVIVANILEITKKMEDAHGLGVKVLTLEEFKKRYDFPLD